MTTVKLDDVAYDRQTEAQPSKPAGARSVGLAKPVEHVGQERGIDPAAGVGNRDNHAGPLLLELKRDASARFGEFDGVRQQVPDDLLQASPVADE